MSGPTDPPPPRAGDADAAAAGGWQVRHHDCLSSTSDEARRLFRAGRAGAGTAVVARQQSGGRGRAGRAWISAPGNLYCTAILRPDCPARDLPRFSFAAALAVAGTVAAFAPAAPVALKWPNDVLAGGAKISGILLESEPAPDAGPAGLLIGIGINIAAAPAGLPHATACLDDLAGRKLAVEAVLQCCLAQLSQWCGRLAQDGFEPLRQAWLARAAGLGRVVTVDRGGPAPLRGRFLALDDDGAMLLAAADGGRRRIAAGDVSLGPG